MRQSPLHIFTFYKIIYAAQIPTVPTVKLNQMYGGNLLVSVIALVRIVSAYRICFT